MKTLKDHIAEFEKEFADLYVPGNEVGNISMERYLKIINNQKEFLSSSLHSIAREALKECRPQIKDKINDIYRDGWNDALYSYDSKVAEFLKK